MANTHRNLDGWRTLSEAIPRGASGTLARAMGLSEDYIRRWRREPDEDTLSATGQRSPLDRVCDLMSAIFLVNPDGVDLVIEHIRAHHASLTRMEETEPGWNPRESAARLLRETCQAVNALNLDDPAVERELLDAKFAIEEALERVRARKSKTGTA